MSSYYQSQARRNTSVGRTNYKIEEEYDKPTTFRDTAKVGSIGYTLGKTHDKMADTKIKKSGLLTDEWSHTIMNKNMMPEKTNLFEFGEQKDGLFGHVQNLLQPAFKRISPSQKGLNLTALSIQDGNTFSSIDHLQQTLNTPMLEDGTTNPLYEQATTLIDSARDNLTQRLVDTGKFNEKQIANIMDLPYEGKMNAKVERKGAGWSKTVVGFDESGQRVEKQVPLGDDNIISKWKQGVAEIKSTKFKHETDKMFRFSGGWTNSDFMNKMPWESDDMLVGTQKRVTQGYNMMAQIAKEQFGKDWKSHMPDANAWIAGHTNAEGGAGMDFLSEHLKEKGWDINVDNLTNNELGINSMYNDYNNLAPGEGQKAGINNMQDAFNNTFKATVRDEAKIVKDTGQLLENVNNEAIESLNNVIESGKGSQEVIETGSNVIDNGKKVAELTKDISSNMETLKKGEKFAKVTGDITKVGKEVIEKGGEAMDKVAGPLAGITGTAKVIDPEAGAWEKLVGAMDVAGAVGADANPYYAAAHLTIKSIDLLEDLIS